MFTVNISGIEEVRDKVERLKNEQLDNILLAVATRLQGDIAKRVYIEGKASDSSQIGTYSGAYMKVRTGNYPETRTKSGEFRDKKTKAGQAGVFTKGQRKGQPRPRYNRNTDTKVILSLTTQMEQDMSVIKIDNGYGIGFNNEFNYNKAIWNEERYKKEIWKPSEEEFQSAKDTVIEKIGELFDLK